MRRHLIVVFSLLVAFAGGIAAEHARSQTRPGMSADVMLNVATGEIPKPTRVHANLDHWPPGTETGWHSHPGPTVFVMLDGELEELVERGQTRKIKAGQAFWHPSRRAHNVRNVGERPARALAVHLDPAG